MKPIIHGTTRAMLSWNEKEKKKSVILFVDDFSKLFIHLFEFESESPQPLTK